MNHQLNVNRRLFPGDRVLVLENYIDILFRKFISVKDRSIFSLSFSKTNDTIQ